VMGWAFVAHVLAEALSKGPDFLKTVCF
jgi:hypothetical protein